MSLRNLLIILFVLSVFMAAFPLCMPVSAQGNNSCKIVVSNKSAIDQKNKVVEISWAAVLKKVKSPDTSKLTVADEKGRQLPVQFETKGSGTIQNLLIQVSVAANSTISLTVRMGDPIRVASKTYCRFVPERYDDFAWENDKIAFRMYGKALEATTFNAYGIDVWAKRTSYLVINKWYKSEDYHADHGEGCDFYGVGYSLGAGNITPFLKDSIYYSKNYSRYEILDNGPLRSTFKLFYDSWPVGDYSARVAKTIQLDAGEQLNRVEAVFSFEGVDSLPVALGINKKDGYDIKLLDEQHKILGYWLPPDSLNGTIGVGCVLPYGFAEMKFFSQHLLAIQTAKSNVPVTYYAGACWDKAGTFSNDQVWFDYLRSFSASLKQPLKVSVQ
jgi:hypothetical protein